MIRSPKNQWKAGARSLRNAPTSTGLRLPPVNVVCAIQTARGQQHNKKERRASEADDNGREYERLWNRIGVQGAYRINQRHGVDAQAPHGKMKRLTA